MKQRRYPLGMLFFIILSLVLGCSLVKPASAETSSTLTTQHIYDDISFFTDQEEQKLNKSMIDLAKKTGIDLIIVTPKDSLGYDPDEYPIYFQQEFCENQHKFSPDCLILYINLSDSKLSIRAFNKANELFDFSRLESIRDTISPYLSDGDYYEAADIFIKKASETLNKDYFYFHIWFQLLVGIALGGIIVGTMAITRKTPVTTNANTYLDQQNSRLRFHHDNYIRTVVTKTKKPQNNNNSGGHGGGRSSNSNSKGVSGSF